MNEIRKYAVARLMKTSAVLVRLLALLVLMACVGCSKCDVPSFDNFDSRNPLRTSQSYRKEAVRALRNILARHEKQATLQDPNNRKQANVVMLYNEEVPVCRLYLGEDWIGFQNCDPGNTDWTQPIYESPMDAEDKRVINILLRH